MKLLSILEVIRHGRQLKESINLHYNSKHAIHRAANARASNHMDLLNQDRSEASHLSSSFRIIKRHFSDPLCHVKSSSEGPRRGARSKAGHMQVDTRV